LVADQGLSHNSALLIAALPCGQGNVDLSHAVEEHAVWSLSASSCALSISEVIHEDYHATAERGIPACDFEASPALDD
jgi:hypothetical protein